MAQLRPWSLQPILRGSGTGTGAMVWLLFPWPNLLPGKRIARSRRNRLLLFLVCGDLNSLESQCGELPGPTEGSSFFVNKGFSVFSDNGMQRRKRGRIE